MIYILSVDILSSSCVQRLSLGGKIVFVGVMKVAGVVLFNGF